MSSPKKSPPAAEAPNPPPFVVPRIWLITLVVLAVVPWLVVAGVLYLRQTAEAVPPPAASSQGPDTAEAPGPWGRLTSTRIVISPPLELIADDWGRSEGSGKYWFFPDTGRPLAEVFLSSTGLTRAEVSSLLATARPEPSIKGLVMLPDPALLRSLTPEVRARLYTQLGRSSLNVNISHAFRFEGTSAEDWIGRSLVSPATRALVDPLTYRHGRHIYFGDVDLIRSVIPDIEERRKLAKALLRQVAYRVRLSVPDLAEVPGLVTYWGRGGRRTDIRPIIESIVGADPQQSIDIVHLLPSFARERLYRYPRRTGQDFDRPILANCLWTALNFFDLDPDDRYLDVNYAVERLKQDYYLVENSPEFGDVIALVDERGNIFHVVNYLADDLVFTKNGMSPMSPWVILPLDDVLDYYRPRSENPRLLYHRRNDF